jgi:hypothetical protein
MSDTQAKERVQFTHEERTLFGARMRFVCSELATRQIEMNSPHSLSASAMMNRSACQLHQRYKEHEYQAIVGVKTLK